MMWRFLILLASLFIISCQSSAEKPQADKTKANPRWILEPPADNTQSLYGVGDGSNRTAAIQAALADISSKISITVNANFERSQSVSTRVAEVVKTDTSRQVQAKISDIKINHYQVEEVHAPLPTRIYVLVRTDRQKLLHNYTSLLDNHIKEFNAEKDSLQSASRFANFQFFKKSVLALDQFQQNRLIVASLRPQAPIDKYIAFAQSVKKQLRDIQNQIRFEVKSSDKIALVFAREMRSILGKKQILASGSSDFIIKISATKSTSKSVGFTVQNYLVNLMVYEKNQLVNSHQVAIKHVGTGTDSATPIKVIKQFNQKLPPILDW